MYYPPYFNSSIDQAAIADANRWREADAKALAEKYAKQVQEYDPQWSQNHTTKSPYW